MRILLLAAAAAGLWAQSPVLIDNDQIKVIRARNTPGQKSRMHKHDVNRVMIHLDAGVMRLTSDKGVARDVKFAPGEVRWDPSGGLHTSENVGGTTYEIIEIEFKKPHGAPVKYPALDPVKTDPKRYQVELENDQVRVVRARLAPRDNVGLHEHGLTRVLIPLTAMNIQQKLPDGSLKTVKYAAREVSMGASARHSEVNLSDQPFEILSVEIK